jgi:hypothetical protein
MPTVNRWLDEESSGGSTNPVTIGALREEIDALKSTMVDHHAFMQTLTFGNARTILSVQADARRMADDINTHKNSISSLVSTHDNTSYSNSEIDTLLAGKEPVPPAYQNTIRFYLVGYLKIQYYNPQQYNFLASNYNLRVDYVNSTTMVYHFKHYRPTTRGYVVDVTSENLQLNNVWTDNHISVAQSEKTLEGFTMRINGGQFKIEKWHIFTCHVYNHEMEAF